ncbi:sialate O-acetylesterase [Roseisolibacter agri]|uniref:9-O-acetylesterase n=1 Tax=Roseisolibacter agri TaxID=2014610 RepID=A0AA37Q2Z3_9BACT|nr:sialate O-acetylesterase [Roseisolibacter agri]GLC23647.1 9-O-acetylesterase [Roseisolibacter agri]
MTFALRALAALGAFTLAAPAHAQVTLHPLFVDGAVLQRGVRLPVWGTAPAGERVTVTVAGQRATAVAGADGAWRVRLAPLAAGGPHVLVAAGRADTARARDVLVGEVWVAGGQSNMGLVTRRVPGADTVLAQAPDSGLRLFLVGQDSADAPIAAPRRGTWTRADSATVAGFSAVAYYFARDLRRRLGVPVGIIGSYWGGTTAETWASRPAMDRVPALQPLLARFDAEQRDPSLRKLPLPKAPKRPAILYNAMIASLQPYAIRGAIWYQGESNAGRATEYRALFPAVIDGWRAGWGQGDFPFLFVQLPGYLPDTVETPRANWAQLRAAQLHVARTVPNVGMIVSHDQGEPHDLHPTRKDVVGARLARAARALAYGEPVAWAGPRFEALRVRGDTAELTFSHARTLVARGDTLAGFELAGADGRWVPARAVVRGARVLAWSPALRAPTAARYGWRDFPIANLTDTDGLPASPFRTDDAPAGRTAGASSRR